MEVSDQLHGPETFPKGEIARAPFVQETGHTNLPTILMPRMTPYFNFLLIIV
jgi:hypothetical protein